jgi:3-demethoxyubiquinol 3-hydroxylase
MARFASIAPKSGLRAADVRMWSLHSIIKSIQSEELLHLSHAEQRIEVRALWSRVLRSFISTVTDGAIWLSTWGDSTRMARDLAAARRTS